MLFSSCLCSIFRYPEIDVYQQLGGNQVGYGNGYPQRRYGVAPDNQLSSLISQMSNLLYPSRSYPARRRGYSYPARRRMLAAAHQRSSPVFPGKNSHRHNGNFHPQGRHHRNFRLSNLRRQRQEPNALTENEYLSVLTGQSYQPRVRNIHHHGDTLTVDNYEIGGFSADPSPVPEQNILGLMTHHRKRRSVKQNGVESGQKKMRSKRDLDLDSIMIGEPMSHHPYDQFTLPGIEKFDEGNRKYIKRRQNPNMKFFNLLKPSAPSPRRRLSTLSPRRRRLRLMAKQLPAAGAGRPPRRRSRQYRRGRNFRPRMTRRRRRKPPQPRRSKSQQFYREGSDDECGFGFVDSPPRGHRFRRNVLEIQIGSPMDQHPLEQLIIPRDDAGDWMHVNNKQRFHRQRFQQQRNVQKPWRQRLRGERKPVRQRLRGERKPVRRRLRGEREQYYMC